MYCHIRDCREIIIGEDNVICLFIKEMENGILLIYQAKQDVSSMGSWESSLSVRQESGRNVEVTRLGTSSSLPEK